MHTDFGELNEEFRKHIAAQRNELVEDLKVFEEDKGSQEEAMGLEEDYDSLCTLKVELAETQDTIDDILFKLQVVDELEAKCSKRSAMRS